MNCLYIDHVNLQSTFACVRWLIDKIAIDQFFFNSYLCLSLALLLFIRSISFNELMLVDCNCTFKYA